jgi:hypothetical protein
VKLKHLRHNEIDFEKWDKTILSSETPLVFAQSFYLNATCPNWEALIIGDYETVFPLTSKSKFGYKYLPQPPFTSQLGAFGKIDHDRVNSFLDYLLNHFKLIEIELNSSNQFETKFKHQKKTFVIPYQDGFSYNQNTKRNLSKAREYGLNPYVIIDNDVVKLSKEKLNPFLKNDLKLPYSAIKKYNLLIDSALKNNYLYALKVLDANRVIKAIGYFISNGKHALFLKGTNFDKKENSGSMHLLMDYAIQYFSDKAVIFDFGGGSNSEGLANFYKGLGGKELIYHTLKVNKLPWLINFMKNKR